MKLPHFLETLPTTQSVMKIHILSKHPFAFWQSIPRKGSFSEQTLFSMPFEGSDECDEFISSCPSKRVALKWILWWEKREKTLAVKLLTMSEEIERLWRFSRVVYPTISRVIHNTRALTFWESVSNAHETFLRGSSTRLNSIWSIKHTTPRQGGVKKIRALPPNILTVKKWINKKVTMLHIKF